MGIGTKLDKLHFRARKNKWLGYFVIFCRIALAAGFVPSGMQKVLGERFTVLAVNHPMGNFLEAFYHTGYYYTFVGVMQVLAAILLLIPRTVTIGAFIYLPIILNICILSLAVRFDGSQITSPLMVCAVLYLLCWDYHKFRNIFPFNHSDSKSVLPQKNELIKNFPFKFFTGVFVVITLVVFHTRIFYTIMPRNTLNDCRKQCNEENDIDCYNFCNCIHNEGKSLEKCLEEFTKSKL
ncbi:DoxX family protein [Galbibacter sp. EGI 63066]|uniref:DoxX family protein n=1 Tax=Galbibacter sp. EGI 63066 TaxID=2993559 RepID=UPI0022491A2F|nr:DoxX family protein [Galbibacter sp. EGI 63066]MCX2680371.1 DoxX family protein [Galbibacter sp. EGI 63066]